MTLLTEAAKLLKEEEMSGSSTLAPTSLATTCKDLDLDKCVGFEPKKKDAILGRGGGANHSKATIAFRALVDSYTSDYARAVTQKEKARTVWKCRSHFKAEGGRIVGRWKGRYYEATERRQYAKIIQRLREQKLKMVPAADGAHNSGGHLDDRLEVFGKPFFPIYQLDDWSI